MSDDGKVFPICCSGDLKADLMTKLIKEAQEGDKGCNFVFVDSVEKKYMEPSTAPIRNDSSPDSPFKGKNAEECWRLLQQLRKDGSDINPTTFAILDNRSTRDETLIIVDADEDDVEAIRAVFDVTEKVLFTLMTAGISMEELKASAHRQPDGVYRT